MSAIITADGRTQHEALSLKRTRAGVVPIVDEGTMAAIARVSNVEAEVRGTGAADHFRPVGSRWPQRFGYVVTRAGSEHRVIWRGSDGLYDLGPLGWNWTEVAR